MSVQPDCSEGRSTRLRTAAGQKTMATARTAVTPLSTVTRRQDPASNAPRLQTTRAWTWTTPQRTEEEGTRLWMEPVRSSSSSGLILLSWRRRTPPKPGEWTQNTGVYLELFGFRFRFPSTRLKKGKAEQYYSLSSYHILRQHRCWCPIWYFHSHLYKHTHSCD